MKHLTFILFVVLFLAGTPRAYAQEESLEVDGLLSGALLLWNARCHGEGEVGSEEWEPLLDGGFTTADLCRAASHLFPDSCEGLGFREALAAALLLYPPPGSPPGTSALIRVDYPPMAHVDPRRDTLELRWAIDCAGFGSSGGIILGGFGIPGIIVGAISMAQIQELGLPPLDVSLTVFMGGVVLTTLGILFLGRSTELRKKLPVSGELRW